MFVYYILLCYTIPWTYLIYCSYQFYFLKLIPFSQFPLSLNRNAFKSTGLDYGNHELWVYVCVCFCIQKIVGGKSILKTWQQKLLYGTCFKLNDGQRGEYNRKLSVQWTLKRINRILKCSKISFCSSSTTWNSFGLQD